MTLFPGSGRYIIYPNRYHSTHSKISRSLSRICTSTNEFLWFLRPTPKLADLSFCLSIDQDRFLMFLDCPAPSRPGRLPLKNPQRLAFVTPTLNYDDEPLGQSYLTLTTFFAAPTVTHAGDWKVFIESFAAGVHGSKVSQAAPLAADFPARESKIRIRTTVIDRLLELHQYSSAYEFHQAAKTMMNWFEFC
ncbi:hypothetical protein Hypma_016164 [Hypsizygus marmoreus]|uniref:Uncharacterized protein n=1 Tax=Hypsizygus marmoreus TaxID=39966 RepID=A0A369J2V6_HYPMA|nr:hypothetical protein Hypma_016164 [Hypsizygus marmoreus]